MRSPEEPRMKNTLLQSYCDITVFAQKTKQKRACIFTEIKILLGSLGLFLIKYSVMSQHILYHFFRIFTIENFYDCNYLLLLVIGNKKAEKA